MTLFSTRQKLTGILWYKYFDAKFTKPVRQGTGSKSTGLVSPACFKRKQFSRMRSINTTTGCPTNSATSGFKDRKARTLGRCSWRGAQVAQQEGQKKAKGHNSSHQSHNSSADQGSARACRARWLSVWYWFHFPAHSVIRAWSAFCWLWPSAIFGRVFRQREWRRRRWRPAKTTSNRVSGAHGKVALCRNNAPQEFASHGSFQKCRFQPRARLRKPYLWFSELI